MTAPLLTVIMPSYNAEPFIAQSIDSVIAQTVEDWELLVVDDASTDATTTLVAHYQRRDRRIRLITQDTNQGAAYARNVGLDQARGDFLAFIDSDDIWFPEKTDQQVTTMEHCRADISYTSYKRRQDHHSDGIVVTVPEQVDYHSMLRRNLIACSTAIVRRATCGSHRMPLIRRRQDHGYWLSLLRDGSRTAIGITEPLVWYRLHPDSLSANKLIAATYTWKLLREVERFRLPKSLWLFAGYAYESVKVRLTSYRR